MFVIVILGLASLPDLNKETFPEIKLYQVKVTVAYPGASATEVEEGICNRLEDATDGISFPRGAPLRGARQCRFHGAGDAGNRRPDKVHR